MCWIYPAGIYGRHCNYCTSQILYFLNGVLSRLFTKKPNYFSRKKSLYHYLHMARTNYRTYLKDEEVRLKKYFYVLRPILAAKWILGEKCAPPMLFDTLVEAELEEGMKPAVSRLLAIKKNTPEMGYGARLTEVNEYIKRKLEEIQTAAETVEDSRREWDEINQLFLKILGNR